MRSIPRVQPPTPLQSTLLTRPTSRRRESELTASTAGWALGTNTVFAQATDNDGLTSQSVSRTLEIIALPAGNENDMYVWDITAESRKTGPAQSLKKPDYRFHVTVQRDSKANGQADTNDTVVAGAHVVREARNSDTGALIETFSGTTDSSGVFTRAWSNKLVNNNFELIATPFVVSLMHETYEWNPDLDATSTSGATTAASLESMVLMESASTETSGSGTLSQPVGPTTSLASKADNARWRRLELLVAESDRLRERVIDDAFGDGKLTSSLEDFTTIDDSKVGDDLVALAD